MFTMLSIERRKQRGRFQFALMLIPVAMSVIWNLQGLKQNDDIWGIFLYRVPLMNAIFIPVFIALFASRLMDIEHKGDTWKLLHTFARAEKIFFTKVIYGSIIIFAALILQSASLVFIGNHIRPETPVPIENLLWLVGTNFFVTEILFLLQCIISTFIQSQAVGIVTGIAGSFLGLFSAFLPQSIFHRLIPWTLYECTISVLMDWNVETRIVTFHRISFPLWDLLVCAIWFFALLIFALVKIRTGNTDEHEKRLHTTNKTTTEKTKHLFLPTEILKMKQPAVWIALFVLPLISALIGTANYLGNLEILKQEWYSLWSQHTLFLDYFFQPVLIGVFASCIWRVEHTGTNWNQLLVSTSANRIFFEKYFTTLFFSSISVLWTAALFIISGKIAGIQTALPKEFPEWIICGIIGSGCVAGAQLLFSLVISNFAIPVGIAFAGSLSGLGMTAKFGQAYILPYSLLAVGMRANNPFYALDYKTFAISAGLQLALFPVIGILYINCTDVKTHN